MPRNATTGAFDRVENSFSEPVQLTPIEPVDATALWVDYDGGLTYALGWAAPLRVVTGAGTITVSNTEFGVGVNKTVGAATAISVPAPADRSGRPITIKDLKGDASTNNITITPASGTIDGQATYVIASDWSKTVLTPLPDGSGYWVG